MVTSETVIQELKDEHAVNSIAVPCPCTCGHPMPADPKCPYCNGLGKIQYGIDDVEFCAEPEGPDQPPVPEDLT